MRLGRKNLLYSMVLAGVMMVFLVGYFIYMLPSLYVAYRMEQNLKSIYEQHCAYRESGSYENVRVKNATACFSAKFPMEGDAFLVTGKAFSAEVKLKDKRLGEILARFRESLSRRKESDADFSMDEEMRELEEILKNSFAGNSALEVHLLASGNLEGDFFNETVKVHSYGGNLVILESGIEDGNNQYTNYIAIEKTEDSILLSVLPVVTPDAEEIRPVVLGSIPMLGAVLLLLVLLFSRMYSRGIVGPILELVRHAEDMEAADDFSVIPLGEEWHGRGDEVGELADTLDDFYMRIKESYQKLEEKNRELEEENRRQEVFLRASSHQLKTPVAAALLLVDGMINEVGRYRETKVYLPKVKEQLLSMRKMTEDILYLNHCAEDRGRQMVDVKQLLEERLRFCQVELAERGIRGELRVESEDGSRTGENRIQWYTNEIMITQILDNLLSNAVKYTPRDGAVRITIKDRNGKEKPEIRIENSGSAIPEELLPHIFEPFVKGNHEDKTARNSHGLGLYIASYYAKKLGISLSVANLDEGVAAVLVSKL